MLDCTLGPNESKEHVVQIRDEMYVGGRWKPVSGEDVIDVIDASTEQTLARVTAGTAEDVDAAVAAAATALPTWSTAPTDERIDAVRAIAAGLGARLDEIGAVISAEVGMPVRDAVAIQAGLAIRNVATHVDLLAKLERERRQGSTLIVHEPIGVVGAITPWNYPLHQIVSKVIPAIGVGCTVVLKPSEVAPMSAFILAEVIDEIGLLPGIFNLVCGRGPVVGEALVTHPGVDMVSFTGSTTAGRRVSELGARTVKRVVLELGGKSANVFLDDADFAATVPAAVTRGCFLNSGQTCAALSRMLVPRGRQDEVVELARAAVASLTVGPADSDVTLGPVASHAQRERVRGYIRKGIAEGATLVAGGAEPPAGLETGFFVAPTIFADVTAGMTIAQEEIFGPVLCIMPYDTEEQAVSIANSTAYGLSGAVHSTDDERAVAFARRMCTGQVTVNNGPFDLTAPFGGYRQSGNGRELGMSGLEEYLETKALMLPAG